jgi:hypothetical protein
LVRNVFQPALHGLNAGNHSSNFAADDGLRCQGLPKCLALTNPFETLLHDRTLSTSRGSDHHPAFVIKIAANQCRQVTLLTLEQPGTVPEYNEDPSTLGTKGVLNWYLDIVERDVRRSSSRRIARLDLRRLDTFTTFNENNCEPILGLASTVK